MKTGELSPLLAEGKAVDWWFAFKFNAATFPGDESRESSTGIFVGTSRDGTPFNQAKVGVSLDASQPLCTFGDMNQQDTLCGIAKTRPARVVQ